MKLKRFCSLFVVTILLCVGFSTAINAQIQRSIVNPSFEDMFTGPNAANLNQFFGRADWITVDKTEIPGWETTHVLQANGCPGGGGYGISAYSCNPIELWANGFIVTPMQGIVAAELNAYSGSKLYQNVCLVNGESFSFTFGHRGRNGVEETIFEVGLSSILDVSTGNSGALGTIVGGGSTSTTRTLVGTWTRYGGNYTYTGASGVQQFGFRSVVPATGGNGNILDDINIYLKPYIEFASSSSKGEMATGSTNIPKLKIIGTVPAGGTTVTMNVSGTATFNSDFNFSGSTTLTNVIGSATSLTVTIPAGNYSDAAGNNSFDIPIVHINNNVVEAAETVILTIPNTTSTSPFVLTSTTVCGAAALASATHTIVDDDTDIQITKTGTASQELTKPVSYTLTVTNNGPLAAPLATFSDIVPTNISGVAAVCGTATGGAAGCSVNVSGNSVTGSIATLPVGGAQVITVTGTAATIGNITNVATVLPPATVNDPNCTVGTSTCTGNNTASQPTTIFGLSDITIAKSHTGNFTVGATGTYSFNVSNIGTLATSGTMTVTDTLPSGLTVNAGAAGAVAAGGTNGTDWTCNSNALTPQTVTCTSNTAIPASGSSVFSISANVGLSTALGNNSITNSVSVAGGGETDTTNNSSTDPTTVLSANLTLAKSDSGSNFTSGSTGTYQFTVGNTGTAPTAGAITVSDTLPTGLTVPNGALTLGGANAANWSCSAASNVVTCTSSTAIAVSANSVFSFSVNVSSTAPVGTNSITNTATVSGGGEATTNGSNNTGTDTTTVIAPDLTVAKTHSGIFLRGTTGTYTFTIGNSGTAPTSGTITLSDTLPSGLTVNGGAAGAVTLGGANAAQWTCNSNSAAPQVITCTSSTALAISGSSVISFIVNIASSAAATVTNVGTVSGGGEPASKNTNNTGTDTVSLTEPPNLSLAKSCTAPANCTTSPQAPGTDLTYQINFTNMGGFGASDLILLDAIPLYTDFKIGTATINPGTTGLTFVIEYSNDYNGLTPSAATWTYTPASAGGGAPSGYDRNVKAIRWRALVGTLPYVSPGNSGSVTFKTRIR